MSDVGATTEEQGFEESGRRGPLVRVAAIVSVAVIGFGLGIFAGLALADDPVGQSPAIDLARDLGLALTVEQQPAFADGVITEDEVGEAGDRFEACVEAEEVAGFQFDFRGQDGWSTSYSDTGDFQAVEECKIRHLKASYNVWRLQTMDR